MKTKNDSKILIPKEYLHMGTFAGYNCEYIINGKVFQSFEDETGAFDTDSDDFPKYLHECAYRIEGNCLIKMKLDTDSSTKDNVKFYAPLEGGSALVVGCDSDGCENSYRAGTYDSSDFESYWDEFGE